MTNKLWELQEFATLARGPEYASLLGVLPDPDPVLRKSGMDYRVYRDLLSDSRVAACVESRKSAVLSMAWGLSQGRSGQELLEFVEEFVSGLDVDGVIRDVLNAPLLGMQPLEIAWERRGGRVVPAKVVGKPAEWFVWGEAGDLRLRTKESLWRGEELPQYKFLVARYNATFLNPYGERVLSRCFWPVSFKRGGMRFWAKFVEKYATPYMVGKHPRGAAREEIEDLADALEKAVQDAVIVIPDDAAIEIREAQGKAASSAIYKDLKDVCDEDIAVAILGQNLTTRVDSASLAAARVHERVRREIKDADVKIVRQVFDGLIRLACELNFGPQKVLPRFELYPESEIGADLAERDLHLCQTGQVRLSKLYFQRAYGFAPDELE